MSGTPMPTPTPIPTLASLVRPFDAVVLVGVDPEKAVAFAPTVELVRIWDVGIPLSDVTEDSDEPEVEVGSAEADLAPTLSCASVVKTRLLAINHQYLSLGIRADN